MTPMLDQLVDDVRGSWRFRWWGFGVACLIVLAGCAILFALPDLYEADAEVFVDTRTALKPVLQALAVDQDVDAQINYVRQSLLQGPQLAEIARSTGVLSPSVTDERKRAAILKNLSNRITITAASAGSQGESPETAGMVYSFEYRDPDRARSLLVVDTLLNTFIDQTLGGKRRGAQSAQNFLATQLKDYAKRLNTAEDRLAAFKKRNIGLMPSEQGGYFAQLQTETDAEKKAETELSIAVSRRNELTKQLHSDAAIAAGGGSLPTINGQIPSGGGTLARIQETQARLDELLLKYTDKHPDVIAARAALAELKQRRAAELASLRRGDASAIAASGAGSNPVYQSIQLELGKEEVNIAALQREVAQHRSTVADLRRSLNSAPQVEAEYQQLNRDYDTNKAEYAALLVNFQKARLGEQADKAGSVRFEVTLPPTSALSPVWPRRNLFLVLIWGAALALGAGAAYGLNQLRPVVSSKRSIEAVTRFPLLGSVSGAFPIRQGSEHYRHLKAFSMATLCLIAAFIVALALNWVGERLNIEVLRALVPT